MKKRQARDPPVATTRGGVLDVYPTPYTTREKGKAMCLILFPRRRKAAKAKTGSEFFQVEFC